MRARRRTAWSCPGAEAARGPRCVNCFGEKLPCFDWNCAPEISSQRLVGENLGSRAAIVHREFAKVGRFPSNIPRICSDRTLKPRRGDLFIAGCDFSTSFFLFFGGAKATNRPNQTLL